MASAPSRLARLTNRARGLGAMQWALLVAGLALVLRLPLIATAGSVAWAGDTEEYMENADALLDGHFDGTYRVPGYGAFIALMDLLPGSREFAVVAAQHLIGVVVVFAIVLVGTRLAGPLAGVMAGLLAALTPVWLGLEHTLQPDLLIGALATLGALALALALAEEKPPARLLVAAGACFAAAAYVKPVGQVLVVGAVLAALLATRSVRRAVRPAIIVAATFAVLVAPWLVRNAVSYDELGLSSQSGQTFFKRVYDIDRRPLPDTPEGRLTARIDAQRRRGEPDRELNNYLSEALRERGYSADEAVAFEGRVARQGIAADPLAYALGTVRSLVRFLTDVNSFSYTDLSSGENSSSLRPGTASPLQLGVAAWYWTVRVLAWAWWIVSLAAVAGLALLFRGSRGERALIAAMASTWLTVALATALTHGGLRRYSAEMAPSVWLVGSAGAVLVVGLVLGRTHQDPRRREMARA